MTDTFVGVLGDVVRPFTYCIIDEVPIGLWGIGGVPMPDLPYLVGEELRRGAREVEPDDARRDRADGAADAEQGRGVAASMSTSEEAKEIIRRWNKEGWSGGKYELAHEIISPNMIVHGAGGQAVGMGPDGLIDLIKTWRTAFPDGRMEIDDLIVEGDTVAIRNTWYGTQRGRVLRHPAERQVGRRHVGRHRPRAGRPRQRGLGRARHGRDDAGRSARCPSSARAPSRPAPTRPGAPTASSSGGARARRTRTARSCRGFVEALANADADAAGALVDADAFVDHSPGWGTQSFASVLDVAGAPPRGDARPELRGRHDEHGLRGRPGRGTLGRPRHAHRRAALRRRAVRQRGRLDAQRLRPPRAAARSSSGGRRPTC